MKRWRPLAWFLLSLACFFGAFYFWRLGDRWQTQKKPTTPTNAPAASNAAAQAAPVKLVSSSQNRESTAPYIPPLHPVTNGVVMHSTNFPYRLSNTAKGIGELMRSSKAILLENALIDSSQPLNLDIPAKLRAQGEPGSYIVQADGIINSAFRNKLQAAGLSIVSYIPNNAYLVTGTAAQVASFGSSAIPFQPYYKVKSALMPLALAGYKASAVNVAVFPGKLEETEAALGKLGVTIGTQSPSPFGTELALQNVNVSDVANLSGIEIIEPYSPRILQNDLTRVLVGVSADTYTPTNYMNLSGKNVTVAVNDSFVPTDTGPFAPTTTINPDLPTMIGSPIIFPQPNIGIADYVGHGTHVAGIIAANGNHSPTNAIGSPPDDDDRGKATNATIFAVPALTGLSDVQLQQADATNALISNNSWGYADSSYDLAAASYDQAVRDSIPGMTGSQSLIYVFAAGNNGGGDTDGDGLGGGADTLSSPGVAKNVITVGASELPRGITNQTFVCDVCEPTNGCATNEPWLGDTSSSNLVADFSSRGNVGVEVEGTFGRFKPDVVAPGTMVVSTRSLTWDTNAYDNPVVDNHVEYDGNIVQTNSIFQILNPFIPCSATQWVISVESTIPPNLPLPILVSSVDNPPVAPADILGTNQVSLPPDALLNPVDAFWFVGIANPTNQPVTFNYFSDIVTTNELGNYFDVLQGMNNALLDTNGNGPFYRYETGTSMAAPAVSGVLALMEDYFTNTLSYTPSPALMKAMLINGARSINAEYDFQVQNTINYQGWGLINLSNSVPTNTTLNAFNNASQMLILDQSTNNALATGDTVTYTVNVNSNAQSGNLRVTLVWTDPPGNPAASLKLVNNLVLIVTNLDTSTPTNPVVYFGNDFPAGNITTETWDGDSNNIPYDTINNVQNVYIPFPLATNYSITVFAKDVNVNAVTANTNKIVQDFALVISSDFTNALTLTSSGTPLTTNYMPDVNELTNQFADSATAAGAFLQNQLVGANPPLLGTNTIPLTNQDNWGNNGQITAGLPNQWHFYVITNTPGPNATVAFFTNALFATFNPTELSIPPVGVNAPNINDATRPEADIDLFVARSSVFGVAAALNLTNLDPTILANCDKSLGRGGTEDLTYTNAQQNEVFVVGVKSEDQEAAEYQFVALFTLQPFNSGQDNWQFLPVPQAIPPGTPSKAGVAQLFTVVDGSFNIQRAVVTNHMEHQNFGDLLGTLKGPGGISVVLNNHTFGNGSTNQILIYEDNGQGDITGSQPSDGPGSLRNFIGKPASGLWMLTESNTSLFLTGQVDSVSLHLDPERLGSGSGQSNDVEFTVEPNTFHYEAVVVPPNATNLTLCVTYDPGNVTFQPVDLFVRYGNDPAVDLPTQTTFDYTEVITPPAGNCLSISLASLPPLKPGTYFVGVYNPNNVPQILHLSAVIGLNVNGDNPGIIVSTNVPSPITEDAVTNNSIFITDNQDIVSVNVGVVLTDPRVSDLDLTLVSPTGQRILLMENRGGPGTTNLGHLNITTNFFGPTVSGGPNANTNIIPVIPNQPGLLVVDYQMYQVPDQMDVYYNGVDIFHSGYISGPGTFDIPYGPAPDNQILIVMNQGNNPAGLTAWWYQPRLVTQDYTYFTFTDDTNLTDIPIKYAIPPFDDQDNGTNFQLSNFDRNTNGDYFATNAPVIIPDSNGGWTLSTNNVFFLRTNYFTGTNMISLATNQVSIVSDPFVATGGTNYMALANGSISRVINVTPQRNYTVSYAYRGPGIAGWWRGEGDANDSSDPELLANNGSLVGRFNFPAGEVGQAFAMEDSGTAFEFAGTNTYVQVRQSPSLNVGANGSGFTVEGWINPTNTTFQQPLVEWLAQVPTNTIVNGKPVTNLVITAGPFLNRANGHYYYLLGQTNWTTSELWANSLGGHLAEVDDANEEQFIYDAFAQIGLSNYTMWIGLTNNPTAANTNFIWSTGNTSVPYTHWGPSEPTNCSPNPTYVAIMGPTNALPGLWSALNNNGTDCGGTNYAPFGVVEVDQIQTNGVQLWISVTNSVTNNVLTGLGRLYANIMDTNNVPHEIFSAPGLIQSNIFQHVALTYNTNTGVAELFYNGTNVATTNLGIFVPNTGGDVLLGKDMSLVSNNFYWGLMDEMSIYSRYLSDSEIASIYNISASTTNRNIGKFDPGITPPLSLAEAQAVFGAQTNLIYGVNQAWQVQGFTFKAQSNTLPVQITGLQPGVLLDSFFVSEQPPGNLYYLPEQALNALVGSNAYGNWTLEIRDSRTGQVATDAQLVSWELQFILQTNTPIPIQLAPETPATNTIPPGQVGYFVVNVPGWALYATNVLVSSTDPLGGGPAPVSMWFNQLNPPLSGNPGDFPLLLGQSGPNSIGNPVLQANPPSFPPLQPGLAYYLAITNAGPTSATVAIEVDYNITTLTNGVPFLDAFKTNDIERPYRFVVDSNATEATFQVLKMSGGNADLVLRQGLPIPSLTSADYGSFSGSNANETIYVLTNSAPVQLSQGTWYMDVVKRVTASDTNVTGEAMTYAVLAKELTNAPNIINISNRVPFTFTAGPGAALTNFFHFGTNNFIGVVPTNIAGIHFELYNQNGNGDLTVQTNAPPLAPQFFLSSQLPGNAAELITIRSNSAPANGFTVTNLVQDYYLGVPNNETNPIKYTVIGVIDTNVFASFPSAEGAGSVTRGGAFGTNVYHVTTLNDSGAGSLRAAVTSTNGGGTVVFDTAGTINLLTPLFITNSGFTIAGQTAPGTNGITLTGAPTYLQDVTDIILRYLRFRPAGTNIMDSLQLTNAQNIIADHVSVAFGTNNVVSILNSSNITVQWSVLADSLNTTNPVTGGTSIRFGSGEVTLHHNLYSDNYSANPTIGEDVTLDFVNNVIYNWGLFAGNSTNDLVGNPGGLTNFLNYSANYLIAGTNSFSTNGAFFGSSPDTYIFQTNNFMDTNLNMVLDGSDRSWGMFSNLFTPFSAPFPIESTAPDEAFIAYERVLDFAGASMDKRDAMDLGTVEQVRTFGGTNAVGPALLSGMSAWWKAENNTVDSISGSVGTWNGTPLYSPGEVNQAFNFVHANYITVPDGPAYRFTNEMSVDAWFILSNYTGRATEIISKLAALPLHANSYTLSVEGVDTAPNPSKLRAYFVVDGTNSASSQLFSSVAIPTNQWIHIAGTYDGVTQKIYINGALSASVPFADGIYPGTQPLSIGCSINGGPVSLFDGLIDEVSLYKRALSDCEVAAIYNAGHAGKQSLLAAGSPGGASLALPFADFDKDGIPDFWEMTLGENPTNFSANLDRDGDGYTDLEEYLNWLGSPHALTLTNMTTNIDLYAMSGKTGNLTFGVANGTNGTVYLTNGPACSEDPASSEFIAVFTPTNTLPFGTNGGFASFTYMVTNMDTVAYFGPVTVSVFVSAVPITNASVFSFPNPPDIHMNPCTNLMVTNAAVPTNGVTYQPIGAPPWETIDTNTGIITFSSPCSVGPGSTNLITTVATDTNVPPDSLTNTFYLIVNGPPVFILNPPPNLTNGVGVPITVTNAATDPDMPASNLFYQLIVPPSPANATIGPNTGIITWTPLPSQLGTNEFETVVTDTNGLSATNIFFVVVVGAEPPYAFTQPAQGVTGTAAQFNGMATPNGAPSMAWYDWGTNTAYNNSTTPVNVGSGITVVYVPTQVSIVPNVIYHYRLTVSNALGVAHGFDQILDEANLVVWGANDQQQSVPPPNPSNISAIAAAYDHSLAVRNNETVVAWGDNTSGQLKIPAGLNNVLAVAGGQYSSMALVNGGNVTAWGGNVFNVTNVPPGATNVVMISGGTDASMALQSSGNVVEWGSGAGAMPSVLTNGDIVEVSSGNFHSLAIKNDGTVIAWGDDSVGQTDVPPGLSNVVQVSGGNFHSLALKSDGTVVAWGYDNDGQTNVPPGLNNVVAVAAGGSHSLALKSDGTLVGWGDDSIGEISFPPNLTNAVAIAAGNLHSLALTPQSLASITGPVILPTTNGAPQTNTILPSQTIFYQVNVPGNADFSTNMFATLGGNLNMYFTTNTPPTITNINDFHLITNAISGSSTLSTNGTPYFIDGMTYYLGLQNTNTYAVSVGVEVDFHFTIGAISTNTAPVSIIHTNINGTNGFLLTWFAPSNDLFEVQWTPSLPVTNWNTFTNPLPVRFDPTWTNINATNTEFDFFDDGSQTGGFGTNRFYQIILLNGTGVAAPTPLSGGVPQTNGIPAGQTAFYQITVPTNAVFATNSLISISGGNLNIWFSTNSPPTTGNPNDTLLIANAASGSRTLTTNGTPPLVDGGTYYLGVENTNSGSVVYGLAVNFGFTVTTNIPPSTNTAPVSIVHTNIAGVNGFLLTWFAPSNDLFEVQWTPSLPVTNWNTFTNPNPVTFNPAWTNVNATNTEFQFFDDGSQTGGFGTNRFYQIILLNGTNSSPAAIPLVNGVPQTNTVSTGQTTFYQVNVPANAVFATNSLISTVGGNLNVWFSTNSPPTAGNPNDFELIANAASGTNVLSASSSPRLNGGTTYYLGVQNGNAGPVTYGIAVNFSLASSATNTAPVSIVHTNISGVNGYLLTWFGPSNDVFQVQWTPSLPVTNWNTFNTNISFDTTWTNINATNTEFDFFDDGSLSGGLGTNRFYQIILINGTNSSSSLAIPLFNGVPLNITNAVGQTNYFSFDITQNNAAVLFELYNLSSNGLMNLNRGGSVPMSSPYFITSSVAPSMSYQQIVLRTNAGLANLNQVSWFLGVPNTNGSPLSYTIRAVLQTNGMLISGLPIDTKVSQTGNTNFQLAWNPTVSGETYEVLTNGNLGATNNWAPYATNIASGTSLTWSNSIPTAGLPALFYWVVQVP